MTIFGIVSGTKCSCCDSIDGSPVARLTCPVLEERQEGVSTLNQGSQGRLAGMRSGAD